VAFLLFLIGESVVAFPKEERDVMIFSKGRKWCCQTLFNRSVVNANFYKIRMLVLYFSEKEGEEFS
jgi:hypothetical protein